ncbi:MAG TPA: nucleotide sugar dehydrogenase [Symbiobacteriaceae bacterium]|nr:nucleotide sugar dehydrogenase [Symbiobacteriaceae bacterium]
MAETQAVLSTLTKRVDVVVIGLGFVGLPLALSYSRKGYRVVGADINAALVAELQACRSVLLEEAEGQSIQDIIRECQRKGTFFATSDVGSAIRMASSIIVTVGIPVKDGCLIFEPLDQVVDTIAKNVEDGALVLIRGTVVPGTTEERILPMLERTGKRLGRDFFLAYAPERIAEGAAFREFAEMPTLVAGCDEESLVRAEKLLSQIVSAPVVRVDRVRIAELSKVVENVQRDVNIAMVQVFARMCEAMGVNASELIECSNTHKRVNLLQPGPGVGGFCLPNALYYLEPKAEELGVDLTLLRVARNINDQVPSLIADRVMLEMAATQAPKKVAVIGLAMKDFSSDARLSPAIAVCEKLIEAGCTVSAYDPEVPRSLPYHQERLEDCLQGASALVLLAKQRKVLLPTAIELVKRMGPNPVVIDTRNWFDDPNAAAVGLRVWRL